MHIRVENIIRPLVFKLVTVSSWVVVLPGISFAQSSNGSPDARKLEEFNSSMFWADTILLFAGLMVIALALILSQRLGNRPVQFGFNKLGLDVKADRLTFVLVVGLMLIGVGVFFRYQNYETQLKSLQLQVERFGPVADEHERNLKAVRDELKQFKLYDLGLEIVFPNVQGDEVKKFFEIGVHVKESQDLPFRLTAFKPFNDFGQTYVKLSNLNRGQWVKIVAKDRRDDTQWTSENDILIPETKVQMKKTEAR